MPESPFYSNEYRIPFFPTKEELRMVLQLHAILDGNSIEQNPPVNAVAFFKQSLDRLYEAIGKDKERMQNLLRRYHFTVIPEGFAVNDRPNNHESLAEALLQPPGKNGVNTREQQIEILEYMLQQGFLDPNKEVYGDARSALPIMAIVGGEETRTKKQALLVQYGSSTPETIQASWLRRTQPVSGAVRSNNP